MHSDSFFTHTIRAQNKDFKMSGHDGQPILNLVGHLHQLLGHANETADNNWLQSCQYIVVVHRASRRAEQGSHKLVQLQPQVDTCTSAKLY